MQIRLLHFLKLTKKKKKHSWLGFHINGIYFPHSPVALNTAIGNENTVKIIIYNVSQHSN